MQQQIAADIENWDGIEEHRTGTQGDRRTAGWLAAEVLAAGLEPRLEQFPHRRRVPGRAEIKVGDRRIDGVPMFDAGATGPEGVTAPLAGLPGGESSIGVGTVGQGAGAEANRAFAEERTSTRPALLAITKLGPEVPGLALQNADRFAAPFGPPVLQVASEHEDWLREAAQAGRTATLVAEAAYEDTVGVNVLVRCAGTLGGPPVIVMTPKSSWWNSTAERGGGIAVWLALLRHFAVNPPARDVVFVATSGHELGHLGLEHFLANHAEAPAEAAWIHLGANFASKDSRRRLQTSDAAMRELALGALSHAGADVVDETPTGERPGGEARNIYDLGGRYVSLLGSNRWFHHPADCWPDTVDVDAAVPFVQAMLAIADHLAAA